MKIKKKFNNIHFIRNDTHLLLAAYIIYIKKGFLIILIGRKRKRNNTILKKKKCFSHETNLYRNFHC